MGYNFRFYSQKQLLLLPPNLDDWLPQDHLARFISDTVDALDLTPFLRRFRDNGQGGAAYHPAMMLKVLLYAYCVGTPSSRKIAQAIIDDVAFRWLAANARPDFRTIATFRRRHLDAIKPVFLQVLQLCKRAGLARAGVVALDGTKVAANASSARNRKKKDLSPEERALLAEVETLLRQAEATDRAEDEQFGDDDGRGLPPVRSAQERRELIRRAKAELEAQAAEEEKSKATDRRGAPKPQEDADGEATVNLTDPHSRVMKTRRGYLQGYNAQVVVSEDQIILAYDVVPDQNDYHQLVPMVEEATANLAEIGEKPGTLLADAGYCTAANLEYLAQPGAPAALVAVKRKDSLPSAPRGRRPKGLSAVQRMARALATKAGKALFRLRGQLVEAVFGQLKTGRGLDHFLLRSLLKVRPEFGLWCLTHNLLKLYRHAFAGG